MNVREYNKRVRELESMFDDISFKRETRNLMTDLHVRHHVGKWVVLADKDRSNPEVLREFDDENGLYEWMFQEYKNRYFSIVSRMDFFIELRQKWISDLLSQYSTNDIIKDYISRSGVFSFERIKNTYGLREVLFAQYFCYDLHLTPANILRDLFVWFQNDGRNQINQFEIAIIQLMSGDLKDFFISFIVLNSYIVMRNVRKTKKEFYFDIDIIKVMNTFNERLQSIREAYKDSVVVQLSETTSVDFWTELDDFDNFNIKYRHYSLLKCENPNSLFV